jgi:uncharacterized protein (TIGR03083 family)
MTRGMHNGGAMSVRRQFRDAVHGFVTLVRAVGDSDWLEPALGEWTVRDLTGHTSRALLTVESYLDPTRTVDHPALRDSAAYVAAAAAALADPAAVAERGRQAAAALGERPATTVSAIAERVLALIDRSDDETLVTTPVGTMTLAGYLPTRTFELVVHSLDLRAATGAEFPAQFAGALAGCLQLAGELAVAQGDGIDVLLALTGRATLPDGFSVV